MGARERPATARQSLSEFTHNAELDTCSVLGLVTPDDLGSVANGDLTRPAVRMTLGSGVESGPRAELVELSARRNALTEVHIDVRARSES